MNELSFMALQHKEVKKDRIEKWRWAKNDNNKDDEEYWKGILYSCIQLKSKPHLWVSSFHWGTRTSCCEYTDGYFYDQTRGPMCFNKMFNNFHCKNIVKTIPVLYGNVLFCTKWHSLNKLSPIYLFVNSFSAKGNIEFFCKQCRFRWDSS